MEETALLLILSGGALIVVTGVALYLFLQWGKRDRANRP
jgi:hypothetical protein